MKFPRTTFTGAVLLSFVIVPDYYNPLVYMDKLFRYQANNNMNRPIFKKMEGGSGPEINVRHMLPREALLNYINNLFLTNVEARFGIVMGPIGTGKSTILRNLCTCLPEGVLYHRYNIYDYTWK